MTLTRRGFFRTTAGLVGGSALALSPGLQRVLAATPPRYRRYDVASPQGQQMLVSYARGIKAMLNKPASDPLNWFRNAFVHFLDCPHENWWFYVWHRGYIGHFERTIRRLSGDPQFTLPFWDWTNHPEVPASLFNGVLNPTDKAFAPYTGNLVIFTDFIKPALQSYWNGLSIAQRQQLDTRGFHSFDEAWKGVLGIDNKGNVDVASMAYANTCSARYPTLSNRGLSQIGKAIEPITVSAGLTVPAYYDANLTNSFTSVKSASHHAPPQGKAFTSILEASPHNLLHNYMGGLFDQTQYPGPFGNMSNNLSPVDPIFFLHHANMDRLWTVWTQRQLAAGLPIEPTGADRDLFMAEPFLFFVDRDGKSITATAADFFSTKSFDYDYAPGYGSDLASPGQALQAEAPGQVFEGVLSNGAVRVQVPIRRIDSHLKGASASNLLVVVTIQRPTGLGAARSFNVLVNAPADLTTAGPGSPYLAGTVAFFGPPMGAHGAGHQATAATTSFAVVLPRTLKALSQRQGLGQSDSLPLEIRVVPSDGGTVEPTLLQGGAIHSR